MKIITLLPTGIPHYSHPSAPQRFLFCLFVIFFLFIIFFSPVPVRPLLSPLYRTYFSFSSHLTYRIYLLLFSWLCLYYWWLAVHVQRGTIAQSPETSSPPGLRDHSTQLWVLYVYGTVQNPVTPLQLDGNKPTQGLYLQPETTQQSINSGLSRPS